MHKITVIKAGSGVRGLSEKIAREEEDADTLRKIQDIHLRKRMICILLVILMIFYLADDGDHHIQRDGHRTHVCRRVHILFYCFPLYPC